MSDETASQASSTVETKAETKKTPSEFTKHWLQAIELASTDEEDWRKDATETLERYSKSKNQTFNILYANTQTTVPALYNSEPAPDVRRRFGDDDEVGERVATLLERAISIQAHMYDFDACMKAAVKDRQLQGRGVTRVRIKTGPNGSKWIACEQVVWDDFRRGPAKLWADVPWVAFRHKMTREELVTLNEKIGATIKLDAVAGEEARKDKKGDDLPDMFKRATVWEVWDRLERKVYFFAESFKDGPLQVIDDPYQLRAFFPTPKPLYQVEQTHTLVPVCEFKIWKPLADEVDEITRRISAIVKVMKVRGLYDGAFASIVTKMGQLEDGQLAAADDPARAMQTGGLDKAIWLWPVEKIIQVVQGLYEAREQAKNHLYELTGVADILRGQTNANETLGAQQIKAQWGSLRLQEAQRDVQRYARDLFRIMADLTAFAMEPPELQAMTGISLAPEIPNNAPPDATQQAQQQMAEAVKLLKSDLLREFAIDIETDSTIRADLTRAQENIATFIQGLAQYFQGVGPAVQAGAMPMPIAIKMAASFARNFKLGREAEEALDEWEKDAEQKAANPPPPQKSPEEKKAEMEMAVQQQKASLDAQRQQQDMQVQQAKDAMELQREQAKLQIERERLQLQREKMALDAQAMQQEHAFKMHSMQEQAAFDAQQRTANAQHEDERRGAEIEFMRQRQAMKPNGEARQ